MWKYFLSYALGKHIGLSLLADTPWRVPTGGGYRGGMGNRQPMGRRRGGGPIGDRDDADWDDDEPIGERRRRSRSTGRYM